MNLTLGIIVTIVLIGAAFLALTSMVKTEEDTSEKVMRVRRKDRNRENAPEVDS